MIRYLSLLLRELEDFEWLCLPQSMLVSQHEPDKIFSDNQDQPKLSSREEQPVMSIQVSLLQHYYAIASTTEG